MDELRRAAARWAGLALVGAAAATLLAMSHHPASAHDATLNMTVHGVMIAVAGVAGYGFLTWSRLRGLDRPPVAVGLIAYLIGMFGGIGAATINGFVVTALVHGEGGLAHDAHRLAWEANQALAQIGVWGTGIAYALWSIDLIRRGDGFERIAGAAGIAAGLIPVGLLASGVLQMNLAGALILYTAQLAWMGLAGLVLLRMARREG